MEKKKPFMQVVMELNGEAIYKSVLQEHEKKKGNVYTQIDRTIFSISKKIQDDACEVGAYAETVKALAALVEARAKLVTYNIENRISPLQQIKETFEECLRQPVSEAQHSLKVQL